MKTAKTIKASNKTKAELAAEVEKLRRRNARMEKALQESDNKCRLFFDGAPDAVFLADTATGIILDANAAAEKLLQRPKGEIIGLHQTQIHPAGKKESVEGFKKHSLGAGLKPIEYSVVRPDGSEVPVEILAHAFEFGGKTLMMGFFRDISERKKAEEAKDSLLKAVSATTEGISITDDEDRFIYVNDAHARIYGYPRHELIGKTWRYTVPSDLVSAVEVELSKTLHNKDVGVWSGECPALRKDGTSLPTEITATARWDDKGRYLGHICVVRDITERKMSENRIKESESRFRSIFEQMTEGIMIADLEGKRHMEANRAICEMLGYTRDELLNLYVEDLHPKEEVSRVIDIFERQVRGEISLAEDIPMLRKDGTIIYADINAAPIVLNGRNCLVGFFRDITERKKADAAMRERERQLAESQRIARIGSWEHNLSTNKAVWSDELFRLLGLDPQKDPADFDMFFGMIHPDDQPLLKKAIEETLKIGKHFSIEYRFILRDGSVRIIHAQAELIRDETGQTILSGTGQDITERKEAEEGLLASRKLVEAVVEATPT